MKFFISLFLASAILIGTNARANGVIIYQTPNTIIAKKQASEFIKERLKEVYGVPGKLIETYMVEICPKTGYSPKKLVMCANKKELKLINSNSLILKSLAVFKRD